MRKIIKINASGEKPEVFHSLKTFFAKYPQYEKHKENINSYLSRKKIPFSIDNFTLYRCSVE
jgi:hypothetical protein